MKLFAKQMGEWILIRICGGVAIIMVLAVMAASFSWGFNNGAF